MDSAVEALRTCVVDDVHLGIRFADLLDVLTKRIRSRFVRMATSSGGGTAVGNGNRAEDNRSPVMLNGGGSSGVLPGGQQQESLSAAAPSSSGWSGNYQAPAQPGSTYPGGIGVGGGYGATPSLGYMNAGGIEGRSATPSNALVGISTESIDPNEGNISIMPPPSLFSYQTSTLTGMDAQPESGSSSNNPNNPSEQQAYSTANQHHMHQQHQQYSHLQPPGLHASAYPQPSRQDDTKLHPSAASTTNSNNNYAQGNMGISSSSAAEDGSSYQADWLALPLDPLLNSHGAGVTQTSLMGPDVGGFDLLEVLLEEEIGQSMGVVY